LLSLTFLLALFLSLYGVPIARQAALKYGIVDAPDGRLKHQKEPVPYFGGLAIYLAFLMSLAFTFEFRQVLFSAQPSWSCWDSSMILGSSHLRRS
jgi:UDP-GlcNAc:undecaprenyl-phosphate GlcNAc-1-phosphate transferase